MEKRKLNIAITIVSFIYLITFVITFIISRIQQKDFSFFSIDGLSLIGAIFSLLELFASNRNFISKWIYKIIFCNKIVNYQIYISFENAKWEVEDYIELLEKCIEEDLSLNDLVRRPVSSLKRSKWNVFYEKIGCSVECLKSYSDFNFSESDESAEQNITLKIEGQGKYGRISSKRKDILYFSSLIKILSNSYLADSELIRKNKVSKIEIIINKDGSQLKGKNLFNENVGEVNEYILKTSEHMKEQEELELSDTKIKWSTIDGRTLLESFDNLTDFLCTVE